MRKTVFIFLCAVYVLAASNTLAFAEGECFVNPDGGRYYHAIANCSAIDSKYWSGMIRISEGELTSEKYASLLKCEICFNQPEPQDEPAQSGGDMVYFNIKNGIYFHSKENCSTISEDEQDLIFSTDYETFSSTPYAYKIPCNVCFSVAEQELFLSQMSDQDFFSLLLHDTHSELMITEAGTYTVGDQLPAGLFTFEVSEGQASEISIIRSTGKTQVFSISGPAEYSFSLFKGDHLTIDGHGTLHDFTNVRLFLDEVERDTEGFDVEEIADSILWIKNGRYLLNAQLLSFKYSISSHDEAEAKIILTQETRDHDIQVEEIVLRPGESITFDVMSNDYRFVEIINCDICVLP